MDVFLPLLPSFLLSDNHLPDTVQGAGNPWEQRQGAGPAFLALPDQCGERRHTKIWQL